MLSWGVASANLYLHLIPGLSGLKENSQLSTKLLKHHWKLLACLSSYLYCTRDQTYRSNWAKKLEQLDLQTLVLAGDLSTRRQHTSSPLVVFSFCEVQSSDRVPVVVYQPVLPAAKVLGLGSMSHPWYGVVLDKTEKG